MKSEHHRKSIRLKGYDYTLPGAYFVTVCTKDRINMFGTIIDGVMMMNNLGNIVQKTWNDLPCHVKNIQLDMFVIMPDHIHGIINIVDSSVGAGSEPAPTGKCFGLPEIVRQLKTFSARRINQLRNTPQQPVWQRNYYERVLRDNKELDAARKYIFYNPLQWEMDNEHAHEEYGILKEDGNG
jgi:REP element-mobilizing transposase RayT